MNKENEISGIVFAAIILTLFLSTITGLTPMAESSESTTSNSLTHAVFAEFGSASW